MQGPWGSPHMPSHFLDSYDTLLVSLLLPKCQSDEEVTKHIALSLHLSLTHVTDYIFQK